MRIGSSQLSSLMLRNIQRNSAGVNDLYNQVSTGKRITQPADDPISTVRLLLLEAENAALTQYQGNIDTLERDLAREESVLGSMNTVLQRMRDITLQAGNGSYGSGERDALAVELEELVGLLQEYGNYQQANGQYIFSGTKSQTQPIQASVDGFIYAGSDQQRQVSISEFSQVTAQDSARSLLFNVGVSASYSASAPQLTDYQINSLESFGQYSEVRIRHNGTDLSVEYDRLDGTVQTQTLAVDSRLDLFGVSLSLSAPPASGDQITLTPVDILSSIQGFAQELKTAEPAAIKVPLAIIDNTMERVGAVQTSVGKRLNTLESVKTSHEDIRLLGQALRSELEDVDLVEAVTRLKFQETILQASQQAYASVQQMGLFSYLR